jgi:hypothetical protein
MATVRNASSGAALGRLAPSAIRVIAIALTIWTASAGTSAAQWYRTYDEARDALKRENWAEARAKFEQAKEEARRSGTKPGRSVLRYGMLREPFLPDLFLAQTYLALAEREPNDAAKRDYLQKAQDAFALAQQGQVRPTDPEFAQLQAGLKSARETVVAEQRPATGGTAPPVDRAPAPRASEPARPTEVEQIQRTMRGLVERADKAAAGGNWTDAIGALQDALSRLDTAPSAAVPALRDEFPQLSSRLAEATFARDVASAFDALGAGRFAIALESLERLQRSSTAINMTSASARSLAAAIPARLAEARCAQGLAEADLAFRQRRWKAAVQGYESAQKLVPSVEFTSAAARDLASQLAPRLRDASINAALDERRFADVLAMDPANRAAIQGQYAAAADAYNAGRWEEAAADFGVLMKYDSAYRDVADRKAAADLQVAYGLGVAAEQSGDSAQARQHYDRVVALQQTIRGPLLESAAIVRSVEGASDRLRAIDAGRGLDTARRQYENGQWDEAINSVNLVLRLLPGHPDAVELLRRLNDRATGEQVQQLIRQSKEALAAHDLDAAETAATTLQGLLPANADARYVLSEVTRMRAERARRNQWLAVAGVVSSIAPLLLVSPRRRGRLFAAIGRPTAALRLYERVLSANPTDSATLSRAAQLAGKHAITAPLGQYFDAYLRARPEDTSVWADAANQFWLAGNTQRAVDLYVKLLSRDGSIPAALLSRVNEFYAGTLPSELVSAIEQRVGRGGSHPELLALLGQQYAARRRTDSSALAVYRAACASDATSVDVRLCFVLALLEAGDHVTAIDQAGKAARLRAPRLEALELLADAHVRAGHDANLLTEHLERLDLNTEPFLVVVERILTARPELRAACASVYRSREAKSQQTLTQSVLRTHHFLDANELDQAAATLQDMIVSDNASTIELRMHLDVRLRYLALWERAHGSTDSAVVARVAQLYAAGQWWDDAVRTWQSIVSVPEWNRRAMAAIAAIVDQLPLVDLARIYFTTGGWQAHIDRSEGAEPLRFLVTPGAMLSADLREQFAATPVFCQSTLITVDDLVGLKRAVLAQARGEQAVAFLVSTHSVRHDVYALIYAFMTEDPAVTLIPLEAQHLRDAIVEARSAGHLERTLHQWLGHTDIYETHNPVSNAATFFGRGHFINQLVLKISRGENFGIFGLRKIGKTSLVYRLRELSRDHLVAYVDLQGVSSRRTDEVYRRLVESLARDMRVKYPEMATPALTLLEPLDEDDSVASRFHADVLAIRRALEQNVSRPPNMLLLLDEIELMVPYGQSPGFEGHQEFFRHLRGLFQQERFIVSAVVGATPMVCRTPKWDGRDNPVFQFYDEVFLAMLDRVECDQMVQGLGELMGVRFDRESLDVIFEQTAGHPYVTRQLCSRLVRLYPERPLQTTAEMVSAAIEEYLAQRGDYFSGVIEGYLNDDARRVVECIAMSDAGAESRANILERFESPGDRHLADRVLGDLELIGLIARTGESYALRAPLFRRWLRRSWLGVE